MAPQCSNCDANSKNPLYRMTGRMLCSQPTATLSNYWSLKKGIKINVHAGTSPVIEQALQAYAQNKTRDTIVNSLRYDPEVSGFSLPCFYEI